MAHSDYHFITHWRVASTVDEVFKILNDPLTLMRWWPSVYLDVKILEAGDEQGLGTVASLHTKGWLPYTLRWHFRIHEQDGPWVDITYDWKIKAEKPLLRYLSFIMKPIFSANHRWAMAKGEESLKLELARLHATSTEELARISSPPQPT
jgi:hypothetical protein